MFTSLLNEGYSKKIKIHSFYDHILSFKSSTYF